MTGPIKNILSIVFPTKKNKWIFYAGDGYRFSENSKYLYLYCSNNTNKDCVWISKNAELIKSLRSRGYCAYNINDGMGIWNSLKSKYVFYSHGMGELDFAFGAQPVHLTHGNYLKHMGDNHKNRDSEYLYQIYNKFLRLIGSKSPIYTLTSNGLPMTIQMSAFNVSKNNSIITGFPRNDILYKNINGWDLGINISAYNKLEKDSYKYNIILYAPTHRRAFASNSGERITNIMPNFDEINSYLSKRNCKMYVSMHPHSEIDINFGETKYIEHLCTGGDLYPYLKFTDGLITDYSSLFYDYLHLDRPIGFYTPDLDSYVEDRGLYFRSKSHFPGPIIISPDSFTRLIDHCTHESEEYQQKRSWIFNEFYEHQDGSSSERIYEHFK